MKGCPSFHFVPRGLETSCGFALRFTCLLFVYILSECDEGGFFRSRQRLIWNLEGPLRSQSADETVLIVFLLMEITDKQLFASLGSTEEGAKKRSGSMTLSAVSFTREISPRFTKRGPAHGSTWK